MTTHYLYVNQNQQATSLIDVDAEKLTSIAVHQDPQLKTGYLVAIDDWELMTYNLKQSKQTGFYGVYFDEFQAELVLLADSWSHHQDLSQHLGHQILSATGLAMFQPSISTIQLDPKLFQTI